MLLPLQVPGDKPLRRLAR